VRVLLVEDNALTVELFEAALETDGHVVITEMDGSAGEARGLSEPFDVILLDIQLPGRTGIEICQTLRTAGIQTPILALSASVLPEDIARTVQAGFTRFLSKPISPQALRLAVRECGPLRAAAQ